MCDSFDNSRSLERERSAERKRRITVHFNTFYFYFHKTSEYIDSSFFLTFGLCRKITRV